MAKGKSSGNLPKASPEDVERARQVVLNTKWSDGPNPIMLGPLPAPPSPVVPVKRGRGRPKGSKNKPKNIPLSKDGLTGKDSPDASSTPNVTSSPTSMSSPYTLVSPSTIDSPYTMTRTLPESPNLGPNPPGRQPLAYGLLDFQDIALFYWPPYRQRRDFDLREQCLILGHRNPRLRSITVEELIEIQEWIGRSETITSEGQRADIRAWRLELDEEDLKALTKQMEEDLKRARRITWKKVLHDRTRRLLAKRRIDDEDD